MDCSATDLEVIVIAPCDEALYQSSVLPYKNSLSFLTGNNLLESYMSVKFKLPFRSVYKCNTFAVAPIFTTWFDRLKPSACREEFVISGSEHTFDQNKLIKHVYCMDVLQTGQDKRPPLCTGLWTYSWVVADSLNWDLPEKRTSININMTCSQVKTPVSLH